MSYGNIHNVLKNKRTDRQRIEMKCQNEGEYSTLNDFKSKRQPLQSTDRERSKIRKYRPATVCLVLLCVFLLTAVIVLCVLIITTINELKKTLSEADGWIYYKSSLYFISSEKKTWSDSRRYCREKAAELIIINNKEEQDFIKNKSDKDGHWIGLSDSDVEGRWKWADGSALTSVFWKTGDPNGGIADNCAKSEPSGWNDISCDVLNKWICEKKILKYVVK
nr:C-type lectin domain family 4 member M-like [Misgurnus anguillicaudatus]